MSDLESFETEMKDMLVSIRLLINKKDVFDNKFNTSYYNTEITPITNQSEAINVNVTFGLVTIVEVRKHGSYHMNYDTLYK